MLSRAAGPLCSLALPASRDATSPTPHGSSSPLRRTLTHLSHNHHTQPDSAILGARGLCYRFVRALKTYSSIQTRCSSAPADLTTHHHNRPSPPPATLPTAASLSARHQTRGSYSGGAHFSFARQIKRMSITSAKFSHERLDQHQPPLPVHSSFFHFFVFLTCPLHPGCRRPPLSSSLHQMACHQSRRTNRFGGYSMPDSASVGIRCMPTGFGGHSMQYSASQIARVFVSRNGLKVNWICYKQLKPSNRADAIALLLDKGADGAVFALDAAHGWKDAQLVSHQELVVCRVLGNVCTVGHNAESVRGWGKAGKTTQSSAEQGGQARHLNKAVL